MTFTYDLTTDIGKARLELGDDAVGSGVKPDGSNITDEEIQVYLDREGSVMRAVAGLCEMLANRWAVVANITVGPRTEGYAAVSQKWADRAKELRSQYGGGFINFSFQPKRVDGYSAAQETDDYAS